MPQMPDLKEMTPDELLAMQAALEARLTEVRESLKVQAEALGMQCALNSGAHKKKGRPSKHDRATRAED